MTSELALTDSPEIAQIRLSDEDWEVLNGLTAKQRAFVFEYPKDFNAKAAADRAGYTGSRYALASRGWELLRHPKVNPLIRKLTTATADEMGITQEWLINEIKDAAAKLEENGDSPVPALSLLAKLRGDLIERVEHDHRVVQVVINDVEVEHLT